MHDLPPGQQPRQRAEEPFFHLKSEARNQLQFLLASRGYPPPAQDLQFIPAGIQAIGTNLHERMEALLDRALPAATCESDCAA
jgi:hypothetical protein